MPATFSWPWLTLRFSWRYRNGLSAVHHLDGQFASPRRAFVENAHQFQRAILALVMPTHKRHFALGRLEFLTSRTYRHAKLFKSDRLA